jgi:HK97 gp10 family phage protein
MSPVAYADLSGLAENFARASGQDFRTAASDLVNSYAVQTASLAQSFAPVKSGTLRDAISIQRPDPLTAIIGPQHVDYAGYQEFGTRTRGEFGGAAYTIRPKKPGGMLKFTVNGRTVYARVVQHPGIPPHPYMRPAFERIVTPFGQSLAQLGASYVKYGQYAPTPIPTQSAA